MSILHSGKYVSVVVDNTKVKIGGRIYETGHVFIVGAHSIVVEATSLKFRMETLVPIESRIDSTMEDVLKVYVPEYKFEVDSYGSKMNVKQNGVIEMVGEIVTLKLESDIETESVIVKIPRFKKVKAQKVKITAENEVSANFILNPLVGVISISKARCVLKESESELEISCTFNENAFIEKEEIREPIEAKRPVAESHRFEQ